MPEEASATPAERMVRCDWCWQTAPHKQMLGGLHCSEACQAAAAGSPGEIRRELAGRGFQQSPLAPNLFVKQGVCVSLEEIQIDGLETALARHAAHPGLAPDGA